MANIPTQSIKFPGLSDTYTFPQIDTSLTTEGKVADAKATGDAINDLKSAISLHDDEIDNTVQTITFASDGSVQKIEHKRNNVVIRTDTFTFATNMITEVRTLNTGETLTIATNLTTLETTVTYAAA